MAFAVLAGALAAYYAAAESLWDLPLWWDVGVLGALLMPAVFALVYLVLPLRRARGLALLGLASIALAFVLNEAGLDAASNFAKLVAMTAFAFWFLGYFEGVTWVLLVAAIVPWVDAYSVWRGPTGNIIKHHRDVFTTLSFAFPVPGEHNAANLGLPDLLFFALFLGASVHFGLRPVWTWLALTLSFGATIAFAVLFHLRGLPALPGLSLGFVLPNADLLWRALRQRRQEPRGTTISPKDS